LRNFFHIINESEKINKQKHDSDLLLLVSEASHDNKNKVNYSVFRKKQRLLFSYITLSSQPTTILHKNSSIYSWKCLL